MNEKELRQKVVQTAMKYIGCKESDGSHKKIIDRYNASKPLARGYAVQYTDAWCATYVSAVFIECGLTDIAPKECGCGKMIDLYIQKGRWQEDDSYTPKIGDVIFYDWQDSGVGDNRGAADHVGIVMSVSGDDMTIIEGNMSDAVGKRSLKVNGRYIRGYGLPDYASKADSSEGTEEKNDTGSTSGGISKEVKWTGEVTASKLNIRKWAGEEYANLTSYPQLNKGTVVEVCDSVNDKDGDTWYYIRIAGKVYGFAHSDYIQKNDEAVTETKPATAETYDVGDKVKFKGNTHYTSSYKTGIAKQAKPCDAKVTATNLSQVHPYHVVGSTVYGWVDKEDIEG